MRLDPFDLARAVATLDDLGILDDPRIVSQTRLIEEDGMRPYLRLAIGAEAAVELHGQGKAAWPICSLTGHNMRRGDVADAPIDAGEDEALLKAMEVVAGWNGYGSHIGRSMEMERNLSGREGEVRLSGFLSWLESIEEAVDYRTARREAIVRLAAIAGGGDPYTQPMDASGLWTVEVVKGVVAYVRKDSAGNLDFAIDLETGRRETFRWNDPCSSFRGAAWMPMRRPWKDMRVQLTYSGCTPEHGGYITRFEDLDDVEASRRHRRLVELLTPRPHAPLLYADGSVISPADRVVIRQSCLEACEGTPGKVTSICGDLVMVKFEGRKKKVPCWPDALERDVGAIAA